MFGNTHSHVPPKEILERAERTHHGTEYRVRLMFLCVQDDEETAEFALDGLKQVMAVKSRSVLPYLVPKVSCPNIHL